MSISEEFEQERDRADGLFGKQPELPWVDGSGLGQHITINGLHGVVDEDEAREMCEEARCGKYIAWAYIVVEELAEALNARTPEHQREELVQLGASVLGAIRALDAQADARV